MVEAVVAKQATPILVTPSALQEWKQRVEGTRGSTLRARHEKRGQVEDVLVDDLNARGVELLNKVGQTAATQIYINGDKAHFTQYGATQMAGLVGGELRRIGSPLAGYLRWSVERRHRIRCGRRRVIGPVGLRDQRLVEPRLQCCNLTNREGRSKAITDGIGRRHFPRVGAARAGWPR